MTSYKEIIARSKEPVDSFTIPLKYKVGQEVRYFITWTDFAHFTSGTGKIKEVRVRQCSHWPSAYRIEYKINSRWRDESVIQGVLHNGMLLHKNNIVK